MNILVTGGAGFIGSNFIRSLLRESIAEYGLDVGRVVNLDKLTYAGNRENLKGIETDPRYIFAQGDIADSQLVHFLLREYGIEAIAHFAAESHVDRSIDSPEQFIQTNVLGTFSLLEAARASFADRPDVQFKFLHVSTDEVYGSLGAQDPRFNEQTRYSPNSPYSASKAASDHIVRSYWKTYGLPVCISNCSNNYGPGQFPEKLIPLMIRKAMRGERLPVYGNGSNIRDWLYVEDHCTALATVLATGSPGETYNIGGNCERTNLQVISALLEMIREAVPDFDSRPPEEMIEFVPDRPGHDRRYAIDSSKIESELGWRPRESFESGLRKTVRWYLKNEEWIRNIENGTYQGERLGAA